MLDLVPSNPYLPLLGMNRDNNNFVMNDLEFLSSSNLRITKGRLITRPGTAKLAGDTLITKNVLHFHIYKDPDGAQILFAFTEDDIFKYTYGGTDWVAAYTGTLGTAVDMWSTVNFIDTTSGATCIACGSINSDTWAAETGGSTRVLLYYERSTGLFTAYIPTVNIPVVDEDTGVTGPASASTVTSTSALTESSDPNFNNIVGGLGQFKTPTGTLCTIGTKEYTLGGGTSYKLIPVDSTITYGNSSYVRKDGSAWSIQFADASHNGEEILVDYTWNSDYNINPRFVWSFRSRLMFGNLYFADDSEYHPWRVYWTDVLDKSLIQYENYQDLIFHGVSPIVGGGNLFAEVGDTSSFYHYIYLVDSIVQVQASSNENLIFEFTSYDSDGMFAGRTLAGYRGIQYYLGKDDVYAFNGTTRRSITQNPDSKDSRIRDYLFSVLDTDNLWACFGVIDKVENNYMLFIKTRDDTTYPSKCFVYNINTNIWYVYDFGETSAAGYMVTDMYTTIDALDGTIAEQGWKFEEDWKGGINENLILYLNSSAYILSEGLTADYIESGDAGTAIASHLVTRDFTYKDLEVWERLEFLKFYCEGTDVDVGYSIGKDTDPADFTSIGNITLDEANNEYMALIDIRANKIRFSFEWDEFCSFEWLQLLATKQELSTE